MAKALPYDRTSAVSIEEYAKQLLNRSLRDIFGNDIEQRKTHKGKLGQLVEELYFQYKPNSKAQADFLEAGVELKTTPIKNIKSGFVAKERLVFNIIDYHKEYQYTFKESSFWAKNQLLLLMFFLYEKDQLDIDAIFKIIRLWRFPVNDLKIIKDDWEKIVKKIKEGKAHEISEGDTFYLGACTKGANNKSKRSQPFSATPAMQRAFSLKSKYLNYIINNSFSDREQLPSTEGYENILTLHHTLAAEPEAAYMIRPRLNFEPIVKHINEYGEGESFEELVIRKFKPFYNKSEKELMQEFDIKTIAKNKFSIIAKAILGIKSEHIEEFEKADILMKTIRLQFNGSIKESMSFKQIKFKEIIKEEWEESAWYEELNRRFFFIIFQEDKFGSYRLKDVKFWTMPQQDMAVVQRVWMDTKKKVIKSDFDHFIKASDNMVGHVRPKGRDSHDLMEAADGSMQKKKCFWLNSSYTKLKIIE